MWRDDLDAVIGIKMMWWSYNGLEKSRIKSNNDLNLKRKKDQRKKELLDKKTLN